MRGGGGGTFPLLPRVHAGLSISRPQVKVTGKPTATQWPFWYLGGAPSVDGYFVQVALEAQENYGGYVGVRTWTKVKQPSKISLSSASGTSTLVTSVAASNNTSFDISVRYSIDGFRSEEFPLHVNRPKSISTLGPFHQTNGNCSPGWRSSFDYEMRDLWGYILIEHATNELFSSHSQQSSNWDQQTNWNSPALNAVWSKGDPDEWVTPYVFRDTISAGNCGNNLSPPPTVPGGNGNAMGAADWRMKATQRIYSGSSTNGQGQIVQDETVKWFVDHGRVE